jgi:hypothetical protein
MGLGLRSGFQGVKKAPDPGSGSATLRFTYTVKIIPGQGMVLELFFVVVTLSPPPPPPHPAITKTNNLLEFLKKSLGG